MTIKRPLVILESPYAGDIERNTLYARVCLRNSIDRGEAPIASHLLYTQPGVLDEFNPVERTLGIDCCHAWLRAADLHVFYTDHDWSTGMRKALELHTTLKNIPQWPRISIRALFNPPLVPSGFSQEIIQYLTSCIERN